MSHHTFPSPTTTNSCTCNHTIQKAKLDKCPTPTLHPAAKKEKPKSELETYKQAWSVSEQRHALDGATTVHTTGGTGSSRYGSRRKNPKSHACRCRTTSTQNTTSAR